MRPNNEVPQTWDQQRSQTGKLSNEVGIVTTLYFVTYGIVAHFDTYSAVPTAMFGFAGLTTGISLVSWIMRNALVSGRARHSPTPSTTEKGQLPVHPRHVSPSFHRFHFLLVVLVWLTVLISLIVLKPGLVPAIYGYFTLFFALGIFAVQWKYKQTFNAALSPQEHLRLSRQAIFKMRQPPPAAVQRAEMSSLDTKNGISLGGTSSI